MGVPGPGGPKGPTLPQTNTTQQNNTTVKTGETTLRQVAARLGGSITEEALRKANPQLKNPNNLQAGQDINLPEKTEILPNSSTSAGPKTHPKKTDGFKGGTYRKGNWEVSGTIKGSTSSVVDGEGSTEARRAKRDQLDGMRRPDERDMDPAKIKKENLEKAHKAVEPMMKDIQKQSPASKGQQQAGDAYELEMRKKVLEREKARFQNPQNIPGKDQK
jgi:hypothetical protein